MIFVIKNVWKWLAGAVALVVVMFLISNVKRAKKKHDTAIGDIETLESNRTGTKLAAKQAEKAHGEVVKQSKKIEDIKQRTAVRVKEIQDGGKDVDYLLAELNNL